MLTFVGVGPGDPELLTLKAVRLICDANAIALPNRGTALRIVRKLVANKPLLELNLPMKGRREDWEAAHDRAAGQLLEWLDRYDTVAFPVLGDPGVYATSSYLCRRIRPAHPCEIVPGVPAMCAAAAALGVPLCEQGEMLTVLDRLDGALPEGNAVVMKASRCLDELRQAARGREIYIAQNLGMEGQWLGKIEDAPEGSGYFTTAIVKR